MSENNLNYIVTLVIITAIFTVTIASIMEHDTSIKIDCIKALSKDHTMDEINKLCGVVK